MVEKFKRYFKKLEDLSRDELDLSLPATQPFRDRATRQFLSLTLPLPCS